MTAEQNPSSEATGSISSPFHPLFLWFLVFYCLATQFHLPGAILLGKHSSSPLCHLNCFRQKTGGIVPMHREGCHRKKKKNTHTCCCVCQDAAVLTSLPPSEVTQVLMRAFRNTYSIILLSWLNPNSTKSPTLPIALSNSKLIHKHFCQCQFALYSPLCAGIRNQLCTAE